MLRRVEDVQGVQVFEAACFPDERGFLLQSFTQSGLERRGIPGVFAQAIQSRSRRGVLRGMHYQWDPPQGKLVRCVSGRILDVAVDLRRASSTQGDHVAVEMSGENHKVIWVPPGFAHGFLALEEDSVVLYFCTTEWNPRGEGGILWNDPALGIHWNGEVALVSARDRQNMTLAEWLQDPRSALFT
jgi:dTDP-4-dehydrorhamnose 3,5-epimerase